MRTDNNTLNDVRSEMMATLRALRDRENPMDLDRAKTMATIAGGRCHGSSRHAHTTHQSRYGVRLLPGKHLMR